MGLRLNIFDCLLMQSHCIRKGLVPVAGGDVIVGSYFPQSLENQVDWGVYADDFGPPRIILKMLHRNLFGRLLDSGDFGEGLDG